MIRIMRNDRELELMPGTTLTLEWNNWLFSDEEKLPGSFSYEIKFPLTPSNLVFIGHSHLPEQIYSNLEVIVQLSSVLNVRCTFDFDVDGQQGIGHLKFEASEVNRKIKNVKLRDAIRTEYNIGRPVLLRTYMQELAEAPVLKYPVVFAPVLNPDFIDKDFKFDVSETKGEAAGEFFEFTYQPYMNAYGKLPDGSRGFLMDETVVIQLVTRVTLRKMGFFLVPFPYLTPVIRELMAWLGFSISSTWIDEPDVACRVIYNTYALDSIVVKGLQNVRVKIREHLPDMTVGEFLKAIRKYFTLSFEFKNPPGVVEIKALDEILDRQEAKDWSAYQTTAARQLNRPENRGYTVKVSEDGGDKLYKQLNFNPTFRIGEGDQSYEVPIGTLPMASDVNQFTVVRWTVPQAAQAGNVRDEKFKRTNAYADGGVVANEFKLRLLSYRGMQPDAGGNLYPLLTSGMYNAQNKKTGNSCDDSRQRQSVYQQYIRRFLNLVDTNRPMQQQLLLPVAELQYFSLSRLLGLRGLNRVWMRHIITKFVVELPAPEGFVRAKVYSYPLLPGKYGPLTANPAPWIELVQFNQRGQNTAPGQNAAFIVDLKLKAWNTPERLATANVSSLTVFYQIIATSTSYGVTEVTSKEYSYVLTGSEAVVQTGVLVGEFPQGGSIYRQPVLIENTEYLIIF